MNDGEKSYWRRFAAEARHLGSPLYEGLALAIDDDPELKALAAQARPGQPHANLLFAAVHFLLLRGVQHPLRNFYGAVTLFPYSGILSLHMSIRWRRWWKRASPTQMKPRDPACCARASRRWRSWSPRHCI